MRLLAVVILGISCLAQEGAAPRQATSLLGDPLYSPRLRPEQRKQLEANLAAAKAAYQKDPSEENIIWLGRRTAYLNQFREAIAVYTKGLAEYPRSYRLLRHRGHRYITVRELDKAIADLEQAARWIAGVPDETEPDGAPNPKNIPTSTSHTNIWYHLGLAYYVQANYEKALAAYRECLALAKNDDMKVATLDWMYMTLRRLNRETEARALLEQVTPAMNILENHAYHNRLLLYKGLKAPESLLDQGGGDLTQLATYGYGVGNWYLANGDRRRATDIFRKILVGTSWPAFGHLAAEADLARMKE
jgi:tetratricopeptide (TPR) repeat protein